MTHKPAFLRAGQICRLKHSCAALNRSDAFSRIALNCCLGVMPSGLHSSTLLSTCRLRPATRTMKNSSRFELTMERNFTRSSKGLCWSWAYSSTRLWNTSRLSSRLT